MSSIDAVGTVLELIIVNHLITKLSSTISPTLKPFLYSLFVRYFALGLLYHYNGQDSAALQVCTTDILLG